MFKIEIENAQNEILTLTQNEDAYQVLSVSGIDQPKANINTTKLAGMDGAMFNSAYLNMRNIVIMVRINGDVENNRLELYRFCRSKENCRFYFENGSRNAYADGYVESVECPLFTNNEVMQISIMCPFPYFKSVQESLFDISDAYGAFTFPFTISEPIPFSIYAANRQTDVINRSESETGAIITITALDSFGKVKISNATTGDTFTLTYSFLKDDKIIINTYKGQKSVYLHRGGARINLFMFIASGSTFFELRIGKNQFSYQIDDGDSDDAAEITIAFAQLYRGL